MDQVHKHLTLVKNSSLVKENQGQVEEVDSSSRQEHYPPLHIVLKSNASGLMVDDTATGISETLTSYPETPISLN